MNYEDIQKVCSELETVDIKGRPYITVNQRVIAFRKLFPDGSIQTDLLHFGDGLCVVKASVYDGDHLLATGLAYEREGSTYINKTSFLENAETSAVGRAIGMLGVGIETSIASADEMQTAIINQTSEKEAPKLISQILALAGGDEQRVNVYTGKLFAGKALRDLTAPQLAALKIDLARKLQAPAQDPMSPVQNINLAQRVN